MHTQYKEVCYKTLDWDLKLTNQSKFSIKKQIC